MMDDDGWMGGGVDDWLIDWCYDSVSRRRSIRERNHPADVEDPFIDGKSTGMVNFHGKQLAELESENLKCNITYYMIQQII